MIYSKKKRPNMLNIHKKKRKKDTEDADGNQNTKKLGC